MSGSQYFSSLELKRTLANLPASQETLPSMTAATHLVPPFHNRIRKACVSVVATLILPYLAYAQESSPITAPQNQINSLQTTIASLQTTVASLQNQLSSLQKSNTTLQSEVGALQNELAAARSVLALAP